MPRTKREGIFYSAVMAFTMSLFMNLFNTFLHAGVSMESLGRVLLLQLIIFAIVMLVEGLVVSNLVHKAMKMSLAMSVIGLILAGTPLVELPLRFASVWPVNFCAAFWWQILVAGPIARMSLKILRSYRKDSELIAEDL